MSTRDFNAPRPAQDTQGSREFERALTMNAAPQRIFDFVSDVRNLPRYLPTLSNAQMQGSERVQVQGEVRGRKYDADGFLRKDPGTMRLEWGAEEGYYSGWMQVKGQGTDRAQVTVHLTFKGEMPGAASKDRPTDAQIEDGMQKSLQSIKNLIEGKGGKEEPRQAY